MSHDQLPGVLGELAPILQKYGYLGLGGFVLAESFGVPLPGEAILIVAAVFAGSGQMNIALVVLVATLAAVIGDNIGYAVGHFGGRPLVLRFGRYVFLTPDRLDHTEEYFNHHGGKIVVVARFIEGLRQLNGILAGTAGMGWPRFLGFNALGALLWVGAWSALGYLAGENISEIYAGFEKYKWYVIACGALVVAVVVAVRVRARRRRNTA